ASRVSLYHQEIRALHVREERIESGQTMSHEVQTRQNALLDARAEILDLRTRLSMCERSEASMSALILRIKECISALEQRSSGPRRFLLDY
ncbi:hypothetical protein Tco_1288311, partial [Tanacetum coccineum]